MADLAKVDNKKKFVFPDIYIILITFIIAVAALSWFIPARRI